MKRKLINSLIFLSIGAFFASAIYILGNQAVRSKGYPGIIEYLSGAGGNYIRGLNVSHETIEITIDEDDFAEMKAQRAKALKEGIMLNIGDNYVSAQIVHQNKNLSAEIRLKGHMTDHLQPRKWSFRVKTDDGKVMGLSKFTLQHPGTRNYIYEWLFHQFAKEQNIIALKYDFVEVVVNGKSWGIYALEEHFSEELLARNKREKGPMLRFDPSLYWQGRLRERERLKFEGDYDQFVGTHVDAYQEGEVSKDSILKKHFVRASYLLESFRRNTLSVSDVFDIELMASYLAIVDIVGGYHSLDWSDVKFYYNPKSDKIEPIAYESFGVRKTRSIAGQNRYYKNDQIHDFHIKLFSDSSFFVAYMEKLTLMADEAYFLKFLDKNAAMLSEKQAILAKSYPLKPFLADLYFDNIKNIKRILDHPACLKVNLNESTSNQLHAVIRNVSNLPILVRSVSYKGEKVDVNQIVEGKHMDKLPEPQLYYISHSWNKIVKAKDLVLEYQILGGKKFAMEPSPFKFDYEGFQDELIDNETQIDSIIPTDSLTFDK